MTVTASIATVARRCVRLFALAVFVAATAPATAMDSEATLLQAARAAGQAQSAVIFGRVPPDVTDASAAGVQESEGAPASGTRGGHSTKVVVITAVVTSLATAALTYLLLRADKPCIVQPEMEYFAPRGYPFLVPVGINPPPRGCVFGRPD